MHNYRKSLLGEQRESVLLKKISFVRVQSFFILRLFEGFDFQHIKTCKNGLVSLKESFKISQIKENIRFLVLAKLY